MDIKKKKWIIGSAIGLVILAISALIMGNTIMARFFPDKYVLLSVLKTQKISQQENKNYKLLSAKHKKIDLNVSLKELKGLDHYYEDIADGLGLSLSVANSKDKDIVIDTEIKKHGANLMTLSIFSSEDELGVILPGLLDQYITVNLDTFKGQYDQTLLPTFLGEIDQEEVNLFKNYVGHGRNIINGEIEDDYKDHLITLAKTAEIKHTGKGKYFLVRLEAEDVKSFIQGLAHSTLDDELDEYIGETTFSNVIINLTIDNKRRILETDLTTTISQDEEMVNVQLTHLLAGDKNIFDQTNTNLRLDIDDYTVIGQIQKDKSISDDLLFKLTDQDEFVMNGLMNLDVEDLKDQSLDISESQKLDLFSMGPMQILDVISRIGKQLYIFNR